MKLFTTSAEWTSRKHYAELFRHPPGIEKILQADCARGLTAMGVPAGANF
jgi:hypothetical protein